MQDFKELKVWQQSHSVTLETYNISAGFPREELYGLTSQVRRAACSIPTNIAEGCGRQSDDDFARFIGIAIGSASELEYLFLLSRDLNYLNSAKHEKVQEKLKTVKRMLISLYKTLKQKS